MTITRRRFIAISAAAGFMPGAALAGETSLRRWSGAAMGARASLAISGIGENRFERLVNKVTAEIERLEAIFSLYRADSDLVRLNHAGTLENPSADMVRLLSLAGSVHRASGGAFDPTVQPLWQLMATTGGRPDAEALAQARRLIGWRQVRVGSRVIGYGRSGMAMTLNGIAQGYATDRVSDLLRAAGMQNVLVSVGEVAALGQRLPGQPWRVGISDREDGLAEQTVNLTDMSIATSSPAGMHFNPADKIGHLLDPATGRPAGYWRRISVMNRSAALADGLSTAFCAMPAERIRDALRHFPGTRLIAVDGTGGQMVESV